MEEIRAALERGQFELASNLALAAVRRGVADPRVFRVAAGGFAARGAFAEALPLLQQSYQLDPRDLATLFSLGVCHTKLGRPGLAVEVLQAALRLDPNVPQVHSGLGEAYAALYRLEPAIAHYRRAVSLAPDYVDALAGLALALATNGETGEARSLAQRAVALGPQGVLPRFVLARADIAERKFADAEVMLRAMIPAPGIEPGLRASLHSALGDALHGQKRPAEAFAAYGAALGVQAQNAGLAPDQGVPELRAALAMLTERFESSWAEGFWPGAQAETDEDRAEAAGHVFLVGFPRSGTTLLEQVLAAHPDVVALDEAPTLLAMSERFFRGPEGLEELAGLDAASARALRKDYWNVVRRAGVDPTGKVFLDKLPLSTINLPIIAKLFPRAKILFAVRDPRDVVLSCFRHAMFELMTLEGTARIYAAVMRLSLAYRACLPLPLHELRYERLVEDFEGQVSALLDFLGLEWSDAVLGFSERMAGRVVNTPSTPQVRRGLYRDGAGQWRAYRAEMAPALPVLAPWLDHYGYAPD